MAAKPRLSLTEVEALVREGEVISSGLPTLPTLKESVRKAREWLARADGLKHPDNYPYVDSLEALVARGRPLPVKLDPLPFLETQVNSARAWRERTARVFLKKNSHNSLLDILSPRMDIGGAGELKKKKRMSNSGKDEVQNHPLFADLTPKELSDPQAIVRAFNEAESRELQVIFHSKRFSESYAYEVPTIIS